MTTINPLQQKAARVAGVMLLYTFFTGLISHVAIWSKLHAPGDVMMTAANIIANERLFRIGVVAELLIVTGVIVLGLALYQTLEPFNKTLAQMAFALKILEGAGIAVISLLIFFSIWILQGRAYLFAFNESQLNTFVGLVLDAHFALISVPLFFGGLGSALFFYLFLKSGYLPRMLAYLGIGAYLNLFGYTVISLLDSSLAATMYIQVIFVTPSILTELIVGPWLLIKGIDLTNNEQDPRTSIS